ncbi:MAG: hypothetical protein PHD00_07395 [Bacteroidales bacterium]|nr:hypothetical protein [Bacteroidales bacterium]MDD4673777.1 hypothetical protein [Bacteroidales bacterium]MDY0349136.1 hypothetical protein [Tenuifilaceae bacterium]
MKELEVSLECEYIDKETHEDLLSQCEFVGRMINSTIGKSSFFCQNRITEG